MHNIWNELKSDISTINHIIFWSEKKKHRMGVAGTLEYFSDLLSNVKRRKKKKQMQTVALKIRMDCEGCERKVKSVLSGVKGR